MKFLTPDFHAYDFQVATVRRFERNGRKNEPRECTRIAGVALTRQKPRSISETRLTALNNAGATKRQTSKMAFVSHQG
jgi:hypothetical protein